MDKIKCEQIKTYDCTNMFFVNDDGIYQSVSVAEDGKPYVCKLIMPKEIFVEALNKFGYMNIPEEG